jgi:hypothetical protein
MRFTVFSNEIVVTSGAMSMKHRLSIIAIAMLSMTTACSSWQPWDGQTFAFGEPQTSASQEWALVNLLVERLGINSEQALGGVGSIFALAQQRMEPSDFMQLSGSIPDMNRYMSAVPQPAASITWFGAAELMGQGNNFGNLAALTNSFQTLGMNSNMIGEFVPVVLQYVSEQSGPATMSLLQRNLY